MQTQQRTVQIQCPICDIGFDPKITNTNICTNCLCDQTNVTENITHDKAIPYCKHCRRYNRPPWILCDRESKDLLNICLKKVNGLNNKTLVEAKFVFTEASTKLIKVQLTLAQEVMNGTSLQQTTVLEFNEVYSQCDDCKREFTPHIWGAQIQLRQRVSHKKTFLYLEQLIIKHHMNMELLKIEAVDEGMNFFFKQKKQALHMLDFIRQYLPIKIRESKEVFSFIKYTFVVDVPKICRDDLVILPKKLCNQLGGIHNIQLCHRISSQIYLVDPYTLKFSELCAEKYFNYELDITTISLKEDGVEFTILDATPIQKGEQCTSCQVELMDNDYNQFNIKSHLGNILQPGMTVLGYDLTKQNNLFEDYKNNLEVVIVKRKSERQRKHKIKIQRLDIEEVEKKQKKVQENAHQEMEEFLDDLVQDPEMKSNIQQDQQNQDKQQQQQLQQ